MGVSIEDERVVHRIDSLRKTGAFIKFLSPEPLIGPLPNFNLQGIDGVIAGGESGPKARPMEESWVTDIRDQCHAANVPFFFKQWGGVHNEKNGRLLEGKTYDGMSNQFSMNN
jgi:protein gp37